MKKGFKVAISVFFILLLVPLKLVLGTLFMVREIVQVDAIFTSFGFILTGISSIINNSLLYIKEKNKNCRRIIYNFFM